MRVWDIPEKHLCRQHLLGQHREIHAIWTTITKGKKGYANHPEVKRWRDCPDALKHHHDSTAEEMKRRGYKHNSPIECVGGQSVQLSRLCSEQDQVRLLIAKGCDCQVLELLETASACSNSSVNG